MIARAAKSFKDHKKRVIPIASRGQHCYPDSSLSLAYTPNAQGPLTTTSGVATGTRLVAPWLRHWSRLRLRLRHRRHLPLRLWRPGLPIFVTTTTLPAGTVGTAYPSTHLLTATGGTNTYTWAITSGPLPGGLNLSTGGLICGTRQRVSTFGFNVTATDGNGQPASRTLSITIAPNGGGGEV